MAFASGLSAQIGVAVETTVGTQVTPPTAFYEFLGETFKLTPTWLDGKGLKANQAYKRGARTVQSRFDVPGGFQVEHADGGHMALLWKHALGALSGPTVVLGTAFKSIITPGPKTGLGLSVQVGRPTTPGAVVTPFTYRGCKISDWEFMVSDNSIAELRLTATGWQEDTAASLGTAAYTANTRLFSFADVSTFTLGGTASTTSGLTTVASGVAVTAVCNSISISGKTPMDSTRYGLGNSGVKREQIENATPEITGSLTAEFANLTDFHNAMIGNTTTPLVLNFAHFDAAGADANGVNAGPNPYQLQFIIPAAKIKASEPVVSGPGIVQQPISFEAYDDGSGTNPVIQVVLVGKDTTP